MKFAKCRRRGDRQRDDVSNESRRRRLFVRVFSSSPTVVEIYNIHTYTYVGIYEHRLAEHSTVHICKDVTFLSER